MRHYYRAGYLARDASPLDVQKLIREVEAMAERGMAADGHASDPPAGPLDSSELLAEDLICLILALKRKLKEYLAAQAVRSTDESLQRENECAVKWMDDTMGDMVATVLGMEVASEETGGNPAKR